jgi:transcriptional regulator with XRE-family HTH domain
MFRRLRLKNKLTLKEVAKRMGAKSHNAYARYEQGKSIPTIEKLSILISAINPDQDFIVSESRV